MPTPMKPLRYVCNLEGKGQDTAVLMVPVLDRDSQFRGFGALSLNLKTLPGGSALISFKALDLPD